MPTTKSLRLVKRGDVVKVKSFIDGTEDFQVVRDASIILHLANGQDARLSVDEEVEFTVEEINEELAKEIEILHAEERGENPIA